MTYERKSLADLLAVAIAAQGADTAEVTQSVTAFLSSLDFYQAYREPMVRLGQTASDVRPPMLAFHLIRNAREHGVEQALLGLDELLALESNDTITVAYVDNVETDVEIDLGDDVRALPDNHVPDEHFYQAILDARSKLVTRRGAVIVARQAQKPFQRLPAGVDLPMATASMDMSVPGMDRIERAVRLITLDGPSAPVIRVSGCFLLSPGVRLFAGPSGASFHFGGSYAPGMPVKITEKPKRLLPLYKKLTKSDRKKVDGAISRLNRAVASAEVTDAIVETAISIEALLGDSNTELTYRLRLRSALLLETDFEKRREIKKVIGTLYDERSTIVHTGYGKAGDHELARRGMEIANHLIEKILTLGGIPVWDDIELTGGVIPGHPA